MIIRIPFSELEEARKNPKEYRIKLDGLSEERKPRKKTYFQTLRNAIFHYHSNNDNLVSAMSYLEDKLEGFTNHEKCIDTIANLNWYVDDYMKRNWKAFETRMNVRICFPLKTSQTLIVSGEVSRIDIHPNGGYVAWLFKNSPAEQWSTQLQMPLIQDEVSKRLNAPISDIKVGIIGFKDHIFDLRSFSQFDVDNARSELNGLVPSMGYDVAN